MQLKNRQKAILQMLLNHAAPLHGFELAQSIGSTTRTLRQDISTINLVFNNYHLQIQSSPSKGYWIDEADKLQFSTYIKQMMEDIIPANQNQRELATCFYLLEHDQEFISMGLLAELFYVSKTTISNTMKHIEEIIQASKGLELVVSSTKGLQIIGSEYHKRNLYSSIILLFYEMEGVFINQYIQAKYDISHNFTTLFEVLMNYFGDQNIMLTNKSLMITTNELLITAFRMKEMHRSIDINFIHDDKDTLPFQDIEDLLNIIFSANEKKYLNHLVKKKRTYNEYKQYDVAMDEIPHTILQEFYEKIEKDFHLDFFNQRKLTEHITAMIYYHQAITHSDNPMLSSMKENHPFAYTIASLMDPILLKYTSRSMHQSELDALTARISVILDADIKQFQTVILTNQSTSLTELLVSELTLYVGENIKLLGIYPFYKVTSIANLSSIDFILATTREKVMADTDIIYIHPILNMEDIMKINHYIQTHLPSYCGIQKKENL